MPVDEDRALALICLRPAAAAGGVWDAVIWDQLLGEPRRVQQQQFDQHVRGQQKLRLLM
jgi:hypothetical protein